MRRIQGTYRRDKRSKKRGKVIHKHMSGIDSPDSYLLSETKTKSVFTVPVNEKTERNEPSPPFGSEKRNERNRPHRSVLEKWNERNRPSRSDLHRPHRSVLKWGAFATSFDS